MALCSTNCSECVVLVQLALCIQQKAQMRTAGAATLAEEKKLPVGTKPAEIKQIKVDTSVTQTNEDVQSDYLR